MLFVDKPPPLPLPSPSTSPCYHQDTKTTTYRRRTMINTRGKKTAIPASKKWKGPGVTSSSASIEARQPLLRFSSGPQEDLFQHLRVRPLGVGCCIDWAALKQVGLADEVCAFITTALWDRFFVVLITFFASTITSITHRRAVALISQLVRSVMTHDSKETSLSLALRYIHTLLAHMLTGRKKSSGVIDRHRKGLICLGPYMTCLARHFSLFDTLEMSSTLTLVGQMAPRGISSMIHIRMIERRHGFDPPQYKLVHSDDQD
ncbi:hypothetical protein GOBAR_AA22707 [Gossypium barbadense]|uniref:Uncharacterized protein n=1 Tax=Gossypium barbadense TaxID=3634 RepID=A0A2P5X3N5_GOSBA|nr:hypothetical protein GOBAR_AA22707 [Gossypium barbadense]